MGTVKAVCTSAVKGIQKSSNNTSTSFPTGASRTTHMLVHGIAR